MSDNFKSIMMTDAILNQNVFFSSYEWDREFHKGLEVAILVKLSIKARNTVVYHTVLSLCLRSTLRLFRNRVATSVTSESLIKLHIIYHARNAWILFWRK